MKKIICAALAAISISIPASAESALCEIFSEAGRADVEITEISSDRAYVLGLDESDFDAICSAAITFSGTGSTDTCAFIVASDAQSAKKIYDKLWKNYEFPACDKSEKTIFVKSGATVAFFKGSEKSCAAYCRAFGKSYGSECMKIFKNQELK